MTGREKLNTSNSRNGFTGKPLPEKDGLFGLSITRDHLSSFEPELVKISHRRFTLMYDKFPFYYAQGLLTREVVAAFQELYGVDISVRLFSKGHLYLMPVMSISQDNFHPEVNIKNCGYF